MRKMIKILLMTAPLWISNTWAQYPNDFSLKELEKEIITKENCAQLVCNSINQIKVTQVNKENQSIRLAFQIDARVDSVVTLPIQQQEISLQNALLNQKPWYSLTSTNNQIKVATPKGTHELELDVVLKGNVLNLNSQRKIIDATSSKDISITNSRIEILSQETKAQELSRQYNIHPLFKVDREIVLDDKWKVKTTVSFLDNISLNKPVVVFLKALPGETVLSENIKNEDGKIRVDIANNPIVFESLLKENPSISITGADNYIQSLTFTNTSNWLFDYKGVSPISKNNSSYASSYSWIFWPQDTLEFNIKKPIAVPGDTMAVESVNVELKTDKSVHELIYSIALKSSLGDKLRIKTPENAVLSQLQVNGQKIPFKVENNTLVVDIIAGKNSVQMTYDMKEKISLFSSYPKIELSAPSINYTYQVQVPQDRWIIWTGGADLRASVLLWGILLACVLFAYPLSKSMNAPLSWLGWSILLLGLSQAGLGGLFFIVIWFALLSIKLKKIPQKRMNYNLLQIGLVFLTLIVASIAIETIAQGLLSYPNLFLEGYASNATQFSWYSEQASHFSPWFISLPVWVYRVIMFSWSIWFAFNVMNWLKWAWESFSRGGIWIAPPVKPVVQSKE